MRAWVVAAGLIQGPDGFVLVQNRRRDGSLDWSPPGGVIEVHEGESVTDGLTREVAEETGLLVSTWQGPVYDVEVVAEELGWELRAEIDASGRWAYRYFSPTVETLTGQPPHFFLAGAHRWVREPIEAWIVGPATTSFRYRVEGPSGASVVVRTFPAEP